MRNVIAAAETLVSRLYEADAGPHAAILAQGREAVLAMLDALADADMVEVDDASDAALVPAMVDLQADDAATWRAMAKVEPMGAW